MISYVFSKPISQVKFHNVHITVLTQMSYLRKEIEILIPKNNKYDSN